MGDGTIEVHTAPSTSTKEEPSVDPKQLGPCVVTPSGELDIDAGVLERVATVSELKAHIAESKGYSIELLELLWNTDILEDDYPICRLRRATLTLVVKAPASYRMNEQEALFTGCLDYSGDGKGRLVYDDGSKFIGEFNGYEPWNGVRYTKEGKAECTFDKGFSCRYCVDYGIASKYPYAF
jgi:hypothetical protein